MLAEPPDRMRLGQKIVIKLFIIIGEIVAGDQHGRRLLPVLISYHSIEKKAVQSRNRGRETAWKEQKESAGGEGRKLKNEIIEKEGNSKI